MMQAVRGYCYRRLFLTIPVSITYVKGQEIEKHNQFVNVIELNSTKCEQVNNTWECPTLEKALRDLNDLNFTFIKIFTTSKQLSRRIPVIKLDTLTIATASKTSKTAIECKSNTMSKLSFTDSSNVCIHGLTFKSCGSAHHDDFIIGNKVKVYISSAVYVKTLLSLLLMIGSLQEVQVMEL